MTLLTIHFLRRDPLLSDLTLLSVLAVSTWRRIRVHPLAHTPISRHMAHCPRLHKRDIRNDSLAMHANADWCAEAGSYSRMSTAEIVLV